MADSTDDTTAHSAPLKSAYLEQLASRLAAAAQLPLPIARRSVMQLAISAPRRIVHGIERDTIAASEW